MVNRLAGNIANEIDCSEMSGRGLVEFCKEEREATGILAEVVDEQTNPHWVAEVLRGNLPRYQPITYKTSNN